MSLIKCTKCGEMYSESYKACPFCAEDEEYYNGKVNKRRRRVEQKKKTPSIVGPALVLVVLLLVAVLVWAFFGDRIKALFEGNQTPGTEQTDPSGSGTDVSATPTDTLTISDKTLALVPDQTAQLEVSGGESYQWINSDPTVATVTESGAVTAVSEGTAIITVTSGDKSATCTVTVREASTPTDTTPTDTAPSKVDVSKITISVPLYGTSLPKISDGHFDVQLGRGESFGLQVEGTDAKAVWSSKNTSIATVGNDGTVKGISSGETTVECKLSDVTVLINVRVR